MNDGALTGYFGRASLDAPPWMEQWPTVAPRPDGAWSASGGGRWATLLPETGEIGGADPRRDRKLPGLAAALELGQLIAYRPSRRAVVAVNGGERFIKVVRPSHLDQLLNAHRSVECLEGVRTPTVLDATADGRVTLSSVHGPRLHDVLVQQPSTTDGPGRLRVHGASDSANCARDVATCVNDAAERTADADVGAGADVGADVERLVELLRLLSGASVQSVAPGTEPSSRLPAARLDDPTRWIRIVGRFDATGASLLETVAATLPDHRHLAGDVPADGYSDHGRAGLVRLGLVHGDLHDKNIMLPTGNGDDRYGVIDFDGAAVGPPELDVGNLGVHLALRVLQRGGSLFAARRAAAALMIASARGLTLQSHASVASDRPIDTDTNSAGTTDASTTDASTTDAGTNSAGTIDAGTIDAVTRHTAFRLACLYWCRRDGRQHVADLVTLALHGVLDSQLDAVAS